MANVACFDQPAVVPPDDFPSEDVALGSSPGAGLGNGQLTQRSTPADKITLFRSLFRGREDVYPRRFASRKSGLAGYAPACANEWIRGVCEKPRIKCAECPNRRFLPVTDQVIRQHLSGHDEFGREFVIGVYPLLLDETCFLLAVDLDGNTWEKDAGAFLETCRRLALPVALERSRSGKGGHIWIFFAEAISATVARNFGSHLLTETMENRPEIGLSSYDRLFPNQDTMPKGGFGNLIALPLQKGPREAGNTVFLDEQFRPLFDQWTFLSSVQKVPRSQVEALARDAERRGQVVGVRLALGEEDEDLPWAAPPSRRRKDLQIEGRLAANAIASHDKRCPGSHHGLWEDRDCRLAHSQARRKHAGARASMRFWMPFCGRSITESARISTLKQGVETGLPEMVVGSETILDTQGPHHGKTDAISK